MSLNCDTEAVQPEVAMARAWGAVPSKLLHCNLATTAPSTNRQARCETVMVLESYMPAWHEGHARSFLEVCLQLSPLPHSYEPHHA